MMDQRMEQQFAFALEVDKLKSIFRQTRLSGHGRRENDAEHSWHIALMAYLFREYANEEVDILRVMLMCLVHDIVEIDAGLRGRPGGRRQGAALFHPPGGPGGRAGGAV